jgi:hypothetical protein
MPGKSIEFATASERTLVNDPRNSFKALSDDAFH